MFLALNEIRHSKLRYALVISVMFLISYLVLFLTGLSYGLAQKYQTSVNQWRADSILLSDESNDSLMMSLITSDTFDAIKATQKAGLKQAPSVIIVNGIEKVNVSFFGVSSGEFLKPNVIEGTMFTNSNDTVVDSGLKKEYNLKLADSIRLSGTNKTLKIVGFSDNSSYAASPVLYISPQTFSNLHLTTSRSTQGTDYNAVVIKGKINQLPENIGKLSISKFINKLPGYNAQVLTFSFMIGFLVVIAAAVIGIFIYVLTIQKVSIFGILKAQGISSYYIAKSVISQTFILAFIGVFLGLVATLGTSLILPIAVPFQVNLIFYASVSILLILVAILGAIFSVKTVVSIDPLKAIS